MLTRVGFLSCRLIKQVITDHMADNRRIQSDHARLRNGYYYCYTVNRTMYIMYTMLLCRYNIEAIQVNNIHVCITISI